MRCWKPALIVMAAHLLSGAVHAQEKPVYRCPGNLYTDALSAKEASDMVLRDDNFATIVARSPISAPQAPTGRTSTATI